MSQIVKTRITKPMSNHFKLLFSRLVIYLETTFISNILLLNHYGQVLFINFRAETVQPTKSYRRFKASWFRNIMVFSQGQLDQQKVPD